MLSVQETRQCWDKKLLKWRSTATALNKQLELPQERIWQLVEEAKRPLTCVVEKLKNEACWPACLPLEKHRYIASALECLKEQLALNRADSVEAYLAQKRSIMEAIVDLETKIDNAFASLEYDHEAVLKTFVDNWLEQVITIEATLDAAEILSDSAKSKILSNCSRRKLR